MPVLHYPARTKPEWVFRIGHFGRWFVRPEPDDGLAAGLFVSVKIQPLALLHVRVITFTVADQRLLAINHRPLQPSSLMINIEGRQVVSLAEAELPVLLEQRLLEVEAGVLG